MSKIIVSLIVALLLSANAGAQCGWFRTFDAANEAEVPYKIIDFENNYFVLLSATSNFPPTTRNAILKFDDQGDYLWRAAATYPIESWADVLFYFPKDFVIAKDSSMYFFSNSQSWDMEGVFLINKFDKNGNLLWYKTYGVSGENFYSGFRGLCLASDSLGLVMTGNTESGDGDYIIYQIDSSGEIIWDHVTDVPVFGYVGNTTPTVRMPDNSYKTAYDNRVLLDYRDYLASFDSAGNLEYSFINPLTGKTQDLAIHPNGNLIYLSNERNPPMFEWGGMRIQMLTPEFDTVWSYLYYDTEFPYIYLEQSFVRNLSVSPEGKILASGYNGGNNMHLVCLSPEGKLLWKREIALEGEVEAGYHNRQFNYATWTSDGCILVGGYIYGTSPQQEYQAKIFLMKLDSVGCLEPGCNQTIITSTKEEWGNPEKNWSIAPNPVSDQVTLNLEGWNGKTGFLIVNDALGHEMLNQRLTRETIIFEVKNWLSGIYVIQIQQETGSVWSSKFVVQH